MKREKFVLMLFASILTLWVYNCMGVSVSECKLNWFEVSRGRFSTQFMFDFSKSFYFEKKLYRNQNRLELSFPAMRIQDFYKNDLKRKLSSALMVKSVSITKESKPIPRVVVNIFFKNSVVNNKLSLNRGMVDQYIIKWSKFEDLEGNDGSDSFRLILEIFTRNSLDELKRDKAMILLTKNEKKKNPHSLEQLKKKLRIVLDVGHGGADPGALGYFALKEKNITLDLARRTRNLLRKNGFNIYLTRNNDKTLSLLERSELAANLKADLFVSLHVNSAGALSKVNGIETYYLKGFSKSTSSNGFLVLSKKNSIASKTFIREIESFIGTKNNLSKRFACNLQTGLVTFLKKKGINVVDRGIKRSLSRVLLRSEVPSALVEVGFLTNKQEARRIANPSYRQLLAQGISVGIYNYIRKLL